jgi:hypothetical protein
MTATHLRLLGVPLAALGLALAVWAPTAASAAAPIGLGTAGGFAVLAGSTVTNTGPSTINGDVGVSPGTALTGLSAATVNGTQHAADGVADQAQTDLATAYDTAAGQSATATVSGDLGGRTLAPGVYAGPTLELTGTLTLDAADDPNAVFVFQAESTLTTASTSVVALVRGADPCNVYWQVGSSATLGTNSVFTGSVLALTSISATTGATVSGRLLARNGATTLDSNTVTRPTCAAVSASPSPTVAPTATASPSTTVTATSSAGPAATPAAGVPASPPALASAGGGTPSGGITGLSRGSASGLPQDGSDLTALALTGAPVADLAIIGALVLSGGLLVLLSARPPRRRQG